MTEKTSAKPPKRPMPEAAERALAEAAERRRQASAVQRRRAEPGDGSEAKEEVGGRDGPDPVRYGDWEKGGLISDF